VQNWRYTNGISIEKIKTLGNNYAPSKVTGQEVCPEWSLGLIQEYKAILMALYTTGFRNPNFGLNPKFKKLILVHNSR